MKRGATEAIGVDLSDVTDLDVTVDGLTRDWKIVQRRRGHRHSTDDLMTAAYAVEHVSPRTRLLDLGSGIGSVGLLVLWRSPEATLTAIEAQEMSHRLLVKNVALNGLEHRVRTILGDLREMRLDGEQFDLVTGSPPYFDVKDGIVSADSQRAHARFELRGDIRDYCAAARAHMSESGRFVFCFPANQRTRAERACAEAGLAIDRTRDVVPREGIPALFSLWVCRHGEKPGPAPIREPDHAVRDATGMQSPAHATVRAGWGMFAR